jgi:hypothetical protein
MLACFWTANISPYTSTGVVLPTAGSFDLFLNRCPTDLPKAWPTQTCSMFVILLLGSWRRVLKNFILQRNKCAYEWTRQRVRNLVSHRLTVRGNRAPRKIFGPNNRGEIAGDCRKLPHGQLHYLHYPRNSVKVVKTENGMCETYDTWILWSRILLEKLIVPQLVQKFTAFYETRKFIIVFIKPPIWPLSWAKWIQSAPSHPISFIFFKYYYVHQPSNFNNETGDTHLKNVPPPELTI